MSFFFVVSDFGSSNSLCWLDLELLLFSFLVGPLVRVSFFSFQILVWILPFLVLTFIFHVDLGQMKFIETDFLWQDAFSVITPHLVESKVLSLHSSSLNTCSTMKAWKSTSMRNFHKLQINGIGWCYNEHLAKTETFIHTHTHKLHLVSPLPDVPIALWLAQCYCRRHLSKLVLCWDWNGNQMVKKWACIALYFLLRKERGIFYFYNHSCFDSLDGNWYGWRFTLHLDTTDPFGRLCSWLEWELGWKIWRNRVQMLLFWYDKYFSFYHHISYCFYLQFYKTMNQFKVMIAK